MSLSTASHRSASDAASRVGQDIVSDPKPQIQSRPRNRCADASATSPCAADASAGCPAGNGIPHTSTDRRSWLGSGFLCTVGRGI
ncbi:MAG: hypothetical protein LIO58_00330 [Oscillospiraceae bacterium]|nr:hypothetical protein [Oscillospiraceae bacterium]